MMLTERRVGALVVLDSYDFLQGIISERDIVRHCAEHGGDAMTAKVADVMTRHVVTAHPGETIDAVLSRMTDRRIRHLPVVQHGKLVGVVSIGDLVKAKIDQTQHEAAAMRAYIATG